MSEAHDPPRSRRILRLIAAERAIRGLLLIAASVYLFNHLHSDFGKLADHVMRAIELDPRKPFLHRIVTYLHDLHASEIKVAAFLALGYGILELVEGTGLWLDQLWAEYLTVISTSVLLPYEIYELIRKPTLLKAGGITVNILIVIYLAVMLRRRVRRERAGKASAAGPAPPPPEPA
jgi:uncharacterized membrane protein (DUF2068 family)